MPALCQYTRLPLLKAWMGHMIILEAETPPAVTSVSSLFAIVSKFYRNRISFAQTEHHIAKISSAHHAFAVSSGMAALDVMTRILKPGDEVVAGDDLYGGTNRLLVYLKVHTGVIVHHVDTTDPKAIIPWLSSKTTMVLLESPTNPLLKIADLAQIACDVKERAPNAIVVVDNTMMSPYLQRPLEHGADLVYDSGTKYLSGHHDLMAGIITCNRDDLAKVTSVVTRHSYSVTEIDFST